MFVFNKYLNIQFFFFISLNLYLHHGIGPNPIHLVPKHKHKPLRFVRKVDTMSFPHYEIMTPWLLSMIFTQPARIRCLYRFPFMFFISETKQKLKNCNANKENRNFMMKNESIINLCDKYLSWTPKAWCFWLI